ncbi:alpha/beta hydrolase [Dysgonomonas sp. 511]|uniref:alpha/beta hydrolase n=1 Tax=Dysgonomonas sp. 511 TaxID=2302930 RepID=UPI0013D700B4|nr:alpha/beta hydrolase [Dysgonomonas sp. 511]NDV78068.1 alpha/beta hydrolase [Dysgonomonas sp. 511]
MNKLLFNLVLLLFICMGINAQKTIKLWDGNPPSKNNITEPEKVERDGGWITNITDPELIIYPASKDNNNKMAVIICPGGGYGGVAIEHEGHQFARWLNERGIAAFVLKYRMPNKNKRIPLDDAQQAMRYVRSNASGYGIDINKIGIAGFSAGGHLAATASNQYATEGISTRPDFSILFYPVITMETATHGGSRKNLLGEKPSATDMHIFSNEKQVNANTPPAILLLSDDDKGVVPENSIAYYRALKENNIPATMYIFPRGGHGWGMNASFSYHTQMLNLLDMWLKDIEKK